MTHQLFAIRLRVSGLSAANQVLKQFICALQERVTMQTIEDIHTTASAQEAEAVVCVPFSYKEQVRIDWNIFIAETEERYLSDFPQMQMDLESVVRLCS